MYLWWSSCTLYLLACQAVVTIGDSGLLLCLCDVFWALSVCSVMSKNTEPNEWLKFVRVWLCFVFILALNRLWLPVTDKLPWTPSSTRCHRAGHRFHRWLNRLRMARARRRPTVGRCRWLSARPSFAIFSRSTNVRRTRYFMSWTRSFIVRRRKKSFAFVVVQDENTKG